MEQLSQLVETRCYFGEFHGASISKFEGGANQSFPPLCNTPTLRLRRSVLRFLRHQHLGQWRIRPKRWRCCHGKLPEEVATKLWQKWSDLGKGRYTQTWSASFISKCHINYPNIDQLHIAYLYIYIQISYQLSKYWSTPYSIYIYIWVLPKIWVHPKWMVKISWKTLSFKWMIWGENPLFFGNIHVYPNTPKIINGCYPNKYHIWKTLSKLMLSKYHIHFFHNP